MSEELETQAESPTEILEPESAPAPEAPQPEAQEASTSSEQDAVFIDQAGRYRMAIDGQEQVLTGAQYDYLAQHGARALMEAQRRQQEEQGGKEPEAPPEDANSVEARIAALEKQNQSLLEQVKNTEVSAETRRLQSTVDSLFQKSQVFKLLKATPETEGALKDLQEEVFATALRKNIPVEQAFSSVESRTSALLGTQQSEYLRKKLEAQSAAPEGVGGRTRNPEKPASFKEWAEDPNSMIRRSMAMLGEG